MGSMGLWVSAQIKSFARARGCDSGATMTLDRRAQIPSGSNFRIWALNMELQLLVCIDFGIRLVFLLLDKYQLS